MRKVMIEQWTSCDRLLVIGLGERPAPTKNA